MATDGHPGRGNSASSLRVRGLVKHYLARRRGVWARHDRVAAVNGVAFEIPAAKTLALVGSSGSGKSTVARCVTRLERPDKGEIWLADTDIAQLGSGDLVPFRSLIQMIFQDPITSMNPAMSAAEIIAEPLLIQRRGTAEGRRLRASELMREVGLSVTSTDRRAIEFSGGQRQRLAIARALVLAPKVLILDEALTGLDLSTQAQIANLLLELQQAHGLTYLLISHDLALVSRMADRVAVMSRGEIVEAGSTAEILSQPQTPETKSLLAAAERFQSAYAATGGGSL